MNIVNLLTQGWFLKIKSHVFIAVHFEISNCCHNEMWRKSSFHWLLCCSCGFEKSLRKTNGCVVMWLLFPLCLSRKLMKLHPINVVSDFITVPGSGPFSSHALLRKPTQPRGSCYFQDVPRYESQLRQALLTQLWHADSLWARTCKVGVISTSGASRGSERAV